MALCRPLMAPLLAPRVGMVVVFATIFCGLCCGQAVLESGVAELVHDAGLAGHCQAGGLFEQGHEPHPVAVAPGNDGLGELELEASPVRRTTSSWRLPARRVPGCTETGHPAVLMPRQTG
jgi:hypothetical protein